VAKRKLTKKELRHDAFSEHVAQGYGYLQKNFLKVFLGIVVVAVVVLATVYVRQSQLRGADEASQLMYQATNQYNSAAYSECLHTLQDLSDRFGGRQEGKDALYFEGACHLALGENEAAISSFEDYLHKDKKGFYGESALSGLGLAQEAAGKNAAALATLGELLGTLQPDDLLYTSTAFAKARVLRKMGRREEAIAVLQPLASGDDLAVKQEATARIQVLKAEALAAKNS
jgi:tetratricopeptide (TPR) repeat protein